MSGRLFDIDEIPEVPLLPEPRRRKGAAHGATLDARFQNTYPPEWHECQRCCGSGVSDVGELRVCPDCLGMGSVKRKVRLLAGFRCERCHHPYLGKGDASLLNVPHLASPYEWSPCDKKCAHGGLLRVSEVMQEIVLHGEGSTLARFEPGTDVEAAWRILTVHHLDGDKANLAWWNLAALCQRCHLQIQAKVVMDRVYPFKHSEWFKPHVAGFYAKVYLGENLSREETMGRLNELLALELAA